MGELTPLEARVLAVLVEKQATVPDTYPLSLNALVAGCNQKTARDPVMETREAEVAAAIDELKALSLVVEVSGARVLRYEHNMGRVLALPSAAVALLAVLMLRGPQTAAELRQNCERLHRFADVSSVEGFLEELAGKAPPRVVRLARAPGTREPRWAQLLCGPVDDAAVPLAAGRTDAARGADASAAAAELAALKAELARQGEDLQRLQGVVRRLARELGIATD
ncbi:MAG TPA: YceH family protein [Rubrivivax sp.]|nr:YceH family protein [Rubrivivax sp.]